MNINRVSLRNDIGHPWKDCAFQANPINAYAYSSSTKMLSLKEPKFCL